MQTEGAGGVLFVLSFLSYAGFQVNILVSQINNNVDMCVLYVYMY